MKPFLATAFLITLLGCSAQAVREPFEPLSPRPSDDVSPEALKQINKRSTVAEIVRVLGQPHEDICSGTYCPTWFASDGTMLTIQYNGGISKRPSAFKVARCTSVPCRRQ